MTDTTETPCARFLILTEDSSEGGPQTVEKILRKMLGAIRPYDATLLEFDHGREEHRRGAAGNAWRNSDQHSDPNVTRLLRYIASLVARQNAYVFFHVDGDAPWERRDESKNADQFRRLVVERVESLLVQTTKRTREEVGEMLGRVVLCMPFYSIEAWCYQNTTAAVALAEKHYGAGRAAIFREWAQDRAALDEIDKPKKCACLASHHNVTLASGGFPVAEVLALGKSFAATVSRLQEAPGLREVLDTCGRAA